MARFRSHRARPSTSAARRPVESPAKAFSGVEHEPAYHADQRGLLSKAWDGAKGLVGAGKYKVPDENTVTFTTGAVEKMLRLKIQRARK